MVPVSETTPAAERLLNLVIALVNAGRRMTREQIRASVVGYAGTSDAAFERTFERDKDLLRELGVPIVTVEGGAHDLALSPEPARSTYLREVLDWLDAHV